MRLVSPVTIFGEFDHLPGEGAAADTEML